MRFYSWKTWEGVGDPIAEPRWLAWDPDAAMAALAYPGSVVLCRAQPAFSAIASLCIQVVIIPVSCTQMHRALSETSCDDPQQTSWRPVIATHKWPLLADFA